jgi:SPP1 family predicted phage head-tail adaptor
MRAGATDRRIIVEENTGATFNDFGERVENWTVFKLLWAEVQERGGREFFEEGQRYASRKVIFRIRPFYQHIRHDMRIRFDGDVFDIKSIQEIGRRGAMAIMCESIE